MRDANVRTWFINCGFEARHVLDGIFLGCDYRKVRGLLVFLVSRLTTKLLVDTFQEVVVIFRFFFVHRRSIRGKVRRCK